MNNRFEHRKTTIKEVAKKAGVSVATVSRVLNNQDIVAQDKRDKVLSIIKEMNFVPNPAARSLSKRQAYKVAVVVPNLISPSLSETITGIFTTMNKEGVDTVLYNSNESSDIESIIFDSLGDRLLEGVIFIAQVGEPLDFNKLAQRLPVAILERVEESNDFDVFTIDDKLGMSKIVGHFVELGHKKIAYFTGISSSNNAARRLKAFYEAMEENGLEVDPVWIRNCDYSVKSGKEAYLKMHEEDLGVTAIVCAGDFIAMGAYSGAMEKGVKVPEDLSISGYDSFADSAYLFPTFTTVDFDSTKAGKMLAEAIITRFVEGNNIPGKKVVIKPQLFIRATSGRAKDATK